MIRCIPILLSVLSALLPAAACAAEQWDLEPTRKQRVLCRDVTRALDEYHYEQGIDVDDRWSSRLLERYLEFLDPLRLHFIASDVAEFEVYENRLDDAALEGDLRPAYAIFNRFQMRREEVLERLLEWARTAVPGLSFDGDEVLEIDREDAPWPADLEERERLWWLRFENDALSLKLADRDQAQIQEVLEKRYEDRLRRHRQVNGKDAFRVFMAALTSLFGPHTEFMPPHEADNFDIVLSRTVTGIGALLSTEGEYCRIDRVIPGGPAARDGRLKAGDRIVSVGQGESGEMVDVVGWRNDEIVDRIRGEKGTTVRLGILPAGINDPSAVRIIALVRDEVRLEEQSAHKRLVERVRDGRAYRIGVIELPAFYMDFEAARNGDENYKSATRDVRRLVEELMAQEVDGIVVDLRGNGGGSLAEAHELTGMFVGEGPVVQVRDASGEVDVLASDHEALYEGPLCVLVDRISASASEIFAAAVQDTGRGLVVGQRTFGKGTVQRLVPMGGGQLKITLAKFYRISGGSTQHQGVVPDVELPSLWDEDEIGESALDDALPWDHIEPVAHRFDSTVKEHVDELRRRHLARRETDPGLRYILDLRAYMDAGRRERVLSLNEAERRRQREEDQKRLLEIENRRRVAEGKPPVSSLADAEREVQDERPLHPLAGEAVELLLDLISLVREHR